MVVFRNEKTFDRDGSWERLYSATLLSIKLGSEYGRHST